MKDQRSDARLIGRRALVGLLALGMAAGRRLGLAQSPRKLPRVGWVRAALGTVWAMEVRAAFEQAFRDLGWVNGQNVVIEFRSVEGRLDRYPTLIDELLARTCRSSRRLSNTRTFVW